jgi:hypothetical protein
MIKKNIILYKKNQGFTIIEALFATVILSFALSTIFILLNSLFKGVGKSKELSVYIDNTPILFSYLSPIIHYKEVQDYNSNVFSLPKYNKESPYNEGDLKDFSNLKIFYNEEVGVVINLKYYANLIYFPIQKSKDKNET